MSLAILLPILIPLVSATVSLGLWRSPRAQRKVAVLGTAGLLAAALHLASMTWEHGYVVKQLGNWPAPFGITLVSDMLSAIMVVVTGVIGFAVALYSLPMTPPEHEKFGYYPLMHILLAGVAGSFLTGDIFNLYVWFEVMLVASFALLTLGGERAQMEGAIKYVTLNLFSSALFLSAVGVLYSIAGTLNMADLAFKLGQVENTGMINVVSVMFMISFGIKAAAFPLFFWLPASYHTPLVAVSALFAGLLTKVGVYALYRVFSLIFYHNPEYTHQILLWGAGLTMVTGVLGAAAQFEFRRILSFHIVSQIGYMMLGIALFTPLALAGGIFYIIHHIIVKTNLFLVSGVIYRRYGSYELADLGGLYRQAPGLAVLFLIPAFSLAGFPPLSGFFAKFMVVRAGVEAGAYVAAAVALAVGLLTLYSMTKVWAEVFWKPQPEHEGTTAIGTARIEGLHMLYLPIVGLAACTVLIGLLGGPVYAVAERAAAQLHDRGAYIQAVLGVTP